LLGISSQAISQAIIFAGEFCRRLQGERFLLRRECTGTCDKVSGRLRAGTRVYA